MTTTMGIFCPDCGKLSLVRERCSSCRLQNFADGALTPSNFGRPRSGEFTLVHVEENSQIEIEINGERRKFDMRGTPTKADIQRLMGELGLTEAQARELVDDLENAVVQVESTSRSHASAKQMGGPLERVDCPGCGRTIAARGWCFYCGHDFTKDETTNDEAEHARAERESVDRRRTARDEVDRKFLEEDVETAHEEQTQKARDAYRNRLEEL